ncbi:MAG: serine--tRNA ligase [Chloroflexi bacterium]|nr:serine--tRNA ligase [Chloroflexota bacterium]
MLSLSLVREHPEVVRAALEKRHTEAPLDRILELDRQRREVLVEAEQLRARRNEVSRQIGRMKERPPELIAEMREVGDRIRELETAITGLETELNNLALQLPNLPAPEVPEGAGAEDNVIVETWGEPRTFDFPPAPHWDIGERLGIIDFERGVRLSGSRFYVLKGAGARLQRALITWMLDVHTRQHGYVEIYPPFMVKGECLVAAGQLPKFADNLYRDIEDDLWMVPTAEVPLTNLYRDEILSADALPIHLVAYTPCFRREKMAAGRDVRGIKRGHQFDKVEMYKFVAPETSDQELGRMVQDATDLLRALGLSYRVLQLCTGDLGFAAAKTFDLEVWAPGAGEWLEVSSLSDCRDFQARRANVRYRPDPKARPEFVHTLNGSGLALPRIMIAVLETYQQADGSVVVPEVLRPYMGMEAIG